MVYIFKSWKSILACMLAVGIILSGGRFIKDKAKVPTSPKSVEEISESLPENEKDAINSLLNKELQYEEQKEALDHSAIMKMNSNKMYRATISYWVDTKYVINYAGNTTKDRTGDILNSYITDLRDDEWKKTALSQIGSEMDIRDFNNLISIGSNGNALVVTVKFDDEDKLKKIINCIKDEIENCKDKINYVIGEHSLSLTNKVIETIVDQELATLQIEKENALVSTKNAINEKKATFNGNQLSVYDYLLAGTEPEAAPAPTKASFSVKTLVLGMFLGAFASCCYFGFKYLFSNKLRFDDNIEAITGIRELGFAEEEKPSQTPIDKFLNNISNKKVKGLTKEQQLDVIVSNIAFDSKENGVSKVCFDVISEKGENLASEIKTELSKVGISAEVVGSLMKNVNFLDNITSSDKVVIIGKIDETDYDQVKNEINLCQMHKKGVMGIVVEL